MEEVWSEELVYEYAVSLYFVPWPKVVPFNLVTFEGLMQLHRPRGCSNDFVSFTFNVTGPLV